MRERPGLEFDLEMMRKMKKKRNVGKKERKFVVIKWVDGKRFEAFWNRYFCGVLYNIL